jgi:hypothetical protein
MATAYYSVELGSGVAGARTYPVSGVGMGGRTSHSARGEYTISAALVINDTIALFDLPRGARIQSGYIKSADLDSNGTPLITLDIGDAGDADRYFAASTVAQAGGVDRTMAATGVDYLTTAKTRVIATVKTAPATSATTGTIVVVLDYWIEEPL